MKKLLAMASIGLMLTASLPIAEAKQAKNPPAAKWVAPVTISGYPEIELPNTNIGEVKELLIAAFSTGGYVVTQQSDNSLTMETLPKTNYGLMTTGLLFNSAYQNQSTSFQCKQRMNFTLVPAYTAETPSIRVIMRAANIQNVGSHREQFYETSQNKRNQQEYFNMLAALRDALDRKHAIGNPNQPAPLASTPGTQ